MTEEFNSFLENCPVVNVSSDSGSFIYWLFGAPIVTSGPAVAAASIRRRCFIMFT